MRPDIETFRFLKILNIEFITLLSSFITLDAHYYENIINTIVLDILTCCHKRLLFVCNKSVMVQLLE